MIPGKQYLDNPRQLLDQSMGLARRGSRQLARIGRRVASDGFGMLQRARSGAPAPKPGMDDTTLARKVETEIFRAADAPKGSVDVSVVDGVVELRGEVKTPELVNELEEKARAVPEVRDVENLLHLPKTPAPTRSDTPASQQRTVRRAAPRRTPRRVTASKAAEKGEKTPKKTAREGKGRQPAPMGSDGAPKEETETR